MIAVLIVSLLLLAAASFVIFRTKRTTFIDGAEPTYFPGPPRTLFDAPAAPKPAADSPSDELAARARALRERAAAGELEALSAAWATGDRRLYDDALSALLKRDPSPENVCRVASYVIKSPDGLRANALLFGGLLTVWKLTPEEVPPGDLLRVAALADDARLFGDAAEQLVAAWEEGRTGAGAAEQLRALLESEYWLLSPETLRSGAGFMLKQQLAEARRRLSAARRG